jgi:hypothetical protein
MKLAIMQPYLFPYIGYYQLVAAVDKFVFYDDVNFIKNGWINRNRLLLSGEVRYFTIPLSGASSFSKINDIIVQKSELWRKKMAESIRHSYSKAPHFREINDLLSEVLFADEIHIAALASLSVTTICRYLDLETQFVLSSACYGNADLHGVERVLDICKREQSGFYYNLPGGRELYNSELFESNGVSLRFIKPNLSAYKQFSEQFHPGLSIIDVLMFNDRNSVRDMLKPEATS